MGTNQYKCIILKSIDEEGIKISFPIKPSAANLFTLTIIILIISSLIIPSSIVESRYNQLINYNSFSCPHELLGNDSTGNVVMYGPYGNQSSPKKIALVIGVHPLERNSHTAVMNALITNRDDLKYAYYLYVINVEQERYNYNKSRINGQLLAKKYVVPHILAHDIDLAVDIHSNQGKYEEKFFIFSPLNDTSSVEVARFLVDNIPGLVYYVPPRSNEPTSAPYVSEPLIRGGVPTVVYEAYLYEPYFFTEAEAEELINSLDQLENI